MYLESLQNLDVPVLTRVVLVILVLAMATTEAVVGRRQHRAFMTELDGASRAAKEASRIALLGRWIRIGCATSIAAIVAVLVLPGIGLAALGLVVPDLESLGVISPSMAAGALVGMVFASVAVALVLRAGRAKAGVALPGSKALDPMMPTTGRGRAWWAGLALSAGVNEEIVYRGLVVLALALALPDAPAAVILGISAVVFGLMHAYQGPVAMVVTGLAGLVLARLYLSTGSLLIPMLIHVLIDLRPLLTTPRAVVSESDEVSADAPVEGPVAKPVAVAA